MRILVTLFLALLINYGSFSQSIYGYMGKRFYVKGAFTASPSIFSRNLEGNMAALKFNVIGTISADVVMNKKQVMAINYKRYSSVASVHSEGLGLIARQGFVFDGGSSSDSWEIGDFRFTTNEIGWNYQFFGKNLDAPLGTFISVGFGFAMSKFDAPFQTLNQSTTSGTLTNAQVLQFDNSTVITSPIIRFGLGKQTVFWDRFLFDVGMDIGLNLAFIGTQFASLNPFGSGSTSTGGSVLTQEEFERVSKKAVQNRVFMMNLVNFRMGLAFLLF
ncbi:MAG: hypothetical protein CL840_20795 [Crocinitomicaceae bacterium]|nr:hypothetical protein [Crocinitomicaceae bacterium]|tara:strand:+ start:4497 stop:5318 length:822 start_codon:yes stop_codon:yes gene_type:complete